jgi:hypothetical protein
MKLLQPSSIEDLIAGKEDFRSHAGRLIAARDEPYTIEQQDNDLEISLCIIYCYEKLYQV